MALRENSKWDHFTLQVTINATSDQVFKAISTRQGFEHWFLREAEFRNGAGAEREPGETLMSGDSYKWLWYGYPDEVEETGRITHMNSGKSIGFTFSDAGNVTLRMEKQAGETLMVLNQYNIPVDEASRFEYRIGCLGGWTFYLANLKSVLEGGLDLRNRNVAIPGVINA